MSIWTHVSGVIRIDSIPQIMSYLNHEKDPTESIINEVFNDSNVPNGSEGPLNIHYKCTYPENYANWGFIVVEGDLRDYEDIDKIEEWWDSFLEQLDFRNLSIRQSAIRIDCEDGRVSIH